MPTLHHYHRPRTLADALALLNEPRGIVLAGGALSLAGTDPAIETFVDLQDVPELRVLESDTAGVQIGGARMLSELANHASVPHALRQSLLRCVPHNILNNVSVDESFQQRSHPLLREWITALVAYDPGVEIALPDGTLQMLNAETMLLDPNVPRGIIVRFLIPSLRERQRFGIASVSRTPADAALVAAAVFIHLEADGRVRQVIAAVSGASAEPVQLVDLSALDDTMIDHGSIASAAAAVGEQLRPVGDYKGSAEYRREMAQVCLRRALEQCL